MTASVVEGLMNLFLVCSNPLLDAECQLSDVPELSVLGILFSSRLIYSYNSYRCSCFHLFPPDCTSDCSHCDMLVLTLFVLSGFRLQLPKYENN